MKRVDIMKNSAEFLHRNDGKTAAGHDDRVWTLREKRDAIVHDIPYWEELRDVASQIKEHTLTHLDQYLEEFTNNAEKNGMIVHFAVDGPEANKIILDILQENKAKTLVKSKSMLTIEFEMEEYLEANGVSVRETDLGERIQQLDHEGPSHIVAPAIHKSRDDVAKLFAEHIGTDINKNDPAYLAFALREEQRPFIVNADAGMTGVNYACAETGTITVITNEGNADMGVAIPKLHIAVMGIEKVIPTLDDVGILVSMTARNATGQNLSEYTSHFSGPKINGQMHVVIIDNGRSERLQHEDFWHSLKCIRCGACLNTCPVYRRSGGLSYESTYQGPMGAIISPTFGIDKYADLPYACSLNGSCSTVCPVKIDIKDQIYKWRRVIAEDENMFPASRKLAMAGADYLLSSPKLFHGTIELTKKALTTIPDALMYTSLNAYGKDRKMPPGSEESFSEWYKKRKK